MNNIIIDEIIASGIAGLLGSLAAIATKPPVRYKEALFRCVSGLILALVMTTYACEWIGIDKTSYSKVSAVSSALGFCGFHALTMLMVILDSAVNKVNESKLGIIPDVIDFIRGKRSDK